MQNVKVEYLKLINDILQPTQTLLLINVIESESPAGFEWELHFCYYEIEILQK